MTKIREPIVLEFNQPVPPVSINALKGRHRAVWGRATAPWRDMAWATMHNHLVSTKCPTGYPVEIQVELRFRTNTRRDPHNYTGTVVKALVDGIVRAGLVPDDTPQWVTVLDPILSVHPRAGHRPPPLRATITIRPRPPRSTL